MNLNRSEVMGRLVADVNYTPEVDGKGARCFFKVVVNRGFKKEDGYDVIPIAAWGKAADICSKLTKGQQVHVIGPIKPYSKKNVAEDGTTTYENNFSVWVTEIQFLKTAGKTNQTQQVTQTELSLEATEETVASLTADSPLPF